MEIVPFSDDIAAKWDKLVAASPDGFALALSAWRAVMLGVPKWEIRDYSFAVSDGNRLLGVMPLQYCPAENMMSSTGWGASGPVAAKHLGHKQRRKVLAAMLDYAEQKARECYAGEFSFSLPPVASASLDAPWGVNPYCEFGFHDVSGISRIVDLSQPEKYLWRACSETGRHAVARARDAGYAVTLGDWQAELDNFYALHQETYIRTHVPPLPREYFAGIAEYMASGGNALLWVCRDMAGHAVAYHNSVIFQDRGLYHAGCSASAKSADGINYLLFWEALCGLKQRGIRWYDCSEVFPQVDDPGDKRYGLTVFKSKFGGENHRYFKCYKRLPRTFLGSGKHALAGVIGQEPVERLSKCVRSFLSGLRAIKNCLCKPAP